MAKHPFIVFGVCIISVLILITLWFFAPSLREGIHDRNERKALQSRDDYQKIAEICSAILTNEGSTLIPESQIPASIRALSLAPYYIEVSQNELTMEFHGGFDHYGYRLKHSDTNGKEWTLFFYNDGSGTMQDEKPLTTITND